MGKAGRGREEGDRGERGHLPVALCFHRLELTGALLPRGGYFGGMGLMRGGMERRERGGVLVGRVMMSQQKLQQEENTEMVQHFFLNFGLPRAEGEW